MTTYKIRTLEMFETIAEYTVEAESEEEAIEQVANGKVAYDFHEHPGNADEFVEVLDVEEFNETEEELLVSDFHSYLDEEYDDPADALANNEAMNNPLRWWTEEEDD